MGPAESIANNPSVLRDEQRNSAQTLRHHKVIIASQGLVFIIPRKSLSRHQSSTANICLYMFVIRDALIINFWVLTWHNRRISVCAALPLPTFANHQLITLNLLDLMFLFAFPLFTFGFLYMLPAVKSIFILTTMVFSDMILLISTFRESVKEQEKIMAERSAEKARLQDKRVPHPTERFR